MLHPCDRLAGESTGWFWLLLILFILRISPLCPVIVGYYYFGCFVCGRFGMEVEKSCTGGTYVVGLFVFITDHDLSRSFVEEIVISNRKSKSISCTI